MNIDFTNIKNEFYQKIENLFKSVTKSGICNSTSKPKINNENIKEIKNIFDNCLDKISFLINDEKENINNMNNEQSTNSKKKY